MTSLAIASSLRAADSRSQPGSLQPGDKVPVLNLTGLDGVPHKLAWSGGGATVIMFFLPSCSVCHSMFPRWNLAFERRPAKLTALGVALELEPPGFFEAYPVRFPVFRGPGVSPADPQQRRGFAEAFKIRQVPTTLRVAAGGLVEEAHVGPADAIRLGEIFRA